jgi:hypothetical protein
MEADSKTFSAFLVACCFLASAVLIGSCSIFRGGNSDRQVIAEAVNVREHAIMRYNARCRPRHDPYSMPYCQKFYDRLTECREILIDAEKATRQGQKAPLQMADVKGCMSDLTYMEK